MRNRPDLAGVVSLVGKVTLTKGQREDLRGVLLDELCATGLKPDSEPNERGLWLDDVLGKLMFY